MFLHIPSPGINNDTSVNADFTADKIKAAKSYFDIADCNVHYKLAKTFQFSLNRCDGVDRQKRTVLLSSLFKSAEYIELVVYSSFLITCSSTKNHSEPKITLKEVSL